MIFITYFFLKYDKNGIFCNLKNYPKKIIIYFFFLSWIMLAYTLSWPSKHLVVIGCKKHLISSLCYKSVKLTFSPTPPSQKALLRSPCQAVTTSENAILYDLRTHWNHQTKVPRGCNQLLIRPYLELAHRLQWCQLGIIHILIVHYFLYQNQQ